MPTYTSHYPPAFSWTYVKATTTSGVCYPYKAADPALSLVGYGGSTNEWWSTDIWQKFNIDLGDAYVFSRLYIENSHDAGDYVDWGIRYFSVYGTNSADAFANLTYANTTDLVLLGTFEAQKHALVDASDPQYFILENTTAYRYLVLRLGDGWNASNLSVRHIEIQSDGSVYGTGTFVPQSPEVFGTGSSEVGMGFYGPNTPSIGAVGSSVTVGAGSWIDTLPIIEGAGSSVLLGVGDFSDPLVLVSAKGTGAIASFGRYKPQRVICKGVGYAGELVTRGIFTPIPPVINAQGSTGIYGRGVFSVKSPNLFCLGAVEILPATITGAGAYSPGLPTLVGLAHPATIGGGEFSPAAVQIHSTGYRVCTGEGVFGPPPPHLSGTSSSVFLDDVLEYNRDPVTSGTAPADAINPLSFSR